MRIFNIAFIFIFIIFAVLQYNDPDPYVWMPIYLYAAFLCYRALQHQYSKPLYIMGLVAYISYGAWLFFDKVGVLDWMQEHQSESIVQSMQATKPWIEETREFFGLVIVIVVLLINMFVGSRKMKLIKR
ncbi:MAG TPA: transmembrane 220 family protein [Hanamia sp.]